MRESNNLESDQAQHFVGLDLTVVTCKSPRACKELLDTLLEIGLCRVQIHSLATAINKGADQSVQ